MIETALFLLVVIGSCGLAESTRRPDPRCLFMSCPAGETCRVFTICPTPVQCNLVARCISPPANSHTGVCGIGDPILIEMGTIVRDTRCGRRLHCPPSTYCNTRLMDTTATCCLSDPESPVKPGECPSNVYSYEQSNCFSNCINDGDCLYTRKCCRRGCGYRCVPPRRRRNRNRNGSNNAL